MDRKGRPCLLNIKGDTGNGAFSKKLEISKKQTSFTFENIKTPVVPSILRNFSSPIKLLRTSSEKELQVLMRYELDPYVRWDAFQTCAFSLIKKLVEKKESKEKTSIDPVILLISVNGSQY